MDINNITINIVIGIISGIILSSLFQLISFLKKRTEKRALKNVLGFHSDKIIVSTPVRKIGEDSGRLHFKNLYSLAHISNILYKAKKEYDILPYHQVMEYSNPYDEICIGGPLGNERTKQFLELYCPKFKIIMKDDIEEKDRIEGWNIYGYQLGSEILKRKPNMQYSFLVKINLNDIKTSHLIIGTTAYSNASAAYYFQNNFKEIHRLTKNRKQYFIALESPSNLGYKSVTLIGDFSNYAF